MDIEGKGAIAEVCFSGRQIHPPPPSISFTHHLPIIYAAYCFRCDEIMQPEFLHVLRRFLFVFSRPCWRIGLMDLPWPPPPDGDISRKYRHRALDETEAPRRSEKIHLSLCFSLWLRGEAFDFGCGYVALRKSEANANASHAFSKENAITICLRRKRTRM